MSESSDDESHSLLTRDEDHSDKSSLLFDNLVPVLIQQAQQQKPDKDDAPMKWKRRRSALSAASKTAASRKKNSNESCCCIRCFDSVFGSEPDMSDAEDEEDKDSKPVDEPSLDDCEDTHMSLPRQLLCKAQSAELHDKLIPLASLQYDPSKQEHRALFNGICSLLDAPEDDAKAVGFQSENPGNDLRGVGMLGAIQFLSLCERHNRLARTLLSLSRAEKKSDGDGDGAQNKSDKFPLAATLLNVTRYIMTVLVEGDGTSGTGIDDKSDIPMDVKSQLATMCNASGSVFDTANNLYAAAAFALLNIWSKGSYRIIDMSKVLSLIEHDIYTKPQTLMKQLFTDV